MKFVFTVIVLFFLCLQLSAQRFIEKTFDTIQVDTSIVYGRADWWDDGNSGFGVYDTVDITLDLYQPSVSDTMSKRPMVIALFGGAFMKGSSERPDIVAWCDSLAHYGYVAAAINYRLGFNPAGSGGTTGPDVGLKRAAWRAIQDGRAAVRYFKAMHDTYNIDTTQIFLLGNSAGAITALHVGYMNLDDWLPEAGGYLYGTSANNVDLGCLDCCTSLDGHWNHSVDVAGIISLWGATLDLAYFEEDENIPVMLVHGTDDGIVPYDSGSPFNMGTGWDVTFTTHGSLPIHQRLDSIGTDHEFYPYQGEGHALYSCGNFNLETFEKDSFPCEHWEPVFNDGIDFLAEYNVYSDEPVSIYEKTKMSSTIYPNPANQSVNIVFDNIPEKTCDIKLYDITGKQVKSVSVKSEQTKLDISGLSGGLYLLKINQGAYHLNQKLIIE
ncbi:MAG: T9SS type A sorting domain-containing protein [Candidatus Delongbacteria bacterium]|jgi:poly(3-hydroxybutyrate) depolymerase|nr:T9SS type A sorting domain-containing protein [Candidatus Delongbacteria bacterium]